MPLKLAPLVQTLSIQDKDANLVKFPIDSEFAWAQREYLRVIEKQYAASQPIRIIILKARQLGISTCTEAVLFWWCFLHDNINSLVVAHENKVASALFDKTKLMWDTWPYQALYSLERSTLQKLKWRETRSSLEIASARNIGTGRGTTVHACHLSEFASYPNPNELMTGLAQTIPSKPRTMVVIESTAKGVGNLFHEMWTNATLGRSDFVPLFFPWWKHYEYRRPTSLATKAELDPDERRLYRMGAPLEAIQWRRWAIPNLAHHDENEFMQEYPATPDEAFLTSGRNVFPLRALEQCYKPMKGSKGMIVKTPHGAYKFVADPSGRLTLFKRPSETRNPDLYFIGCDPSRSTTGDPACIQVINRRTHEQVAVWHGGIDPEHLAHELMLLGSFFHGCEICPEAEGGGQITVGALLQAGYPRIWQDRRPDRNPGKVLGAYGFSTNFSRKHWAIGHLIYLLGERSIIIHDPATYAEMRDYTAWGDGEMGNGNGSAHDDTVMGLAIACVASMAVGPYVPAGMPQPEPLEIYAGSGG